MGSAQSEGEFQRHIVSMQKLTTLTIVMPACRHIYIFINIHTCNMYLNYLIINVYKCIYIYIHLSEL